jgi:hypothetical protein
MGEVQKLPEERPESALAAPPDWEDRAQDLAIEALKDVVECDDSGMFVKWVLSPGGHRVPMLFILFGNCVADKKLPEVHFDELGVKRPAMGVLLADPTTGELYKDSTIGPRVRREVEHYFMLYGIRTTRFSDLPPLPDMALRRRVLPKETVQ